MRERREEEPTAKNKSHSKEEWERRRLVEDSGGIGVQGREKAAAMRVRKNR